MFRQTHHRVISYLDSARSSVLLKSSTLLEHNNIAVSSYPSAHEFLKHGNFDGFACFLFDNHLDGISGFELLEILRSRNVEAPAIVMAGRPSVALLRRRSAKLGKVAVVDKPATGDELMGCVERALSGGL